MRTIDQWFAAYQESHRNPTNKIIHFICVPAIFWSVLALLYNVRPPSGAPWFVNAASAVGVVGCLYYLALSKLLGSVMVLVVALMLGSCYVLTQSMGAPLWSVALTVFVLAWAGQFYGHKIEGKKPSFLMDLQFLLIGPLWVLGHLLGRTSTPGTPPEGLHP